MLNRYASILNKLDTIIKIAKMSRPRAHNLSEYQRKGTEDQHVYASRYVKARKLNRINKKAKLVAESMANQVESLLDCGQSNQTNHPQNIGKKRKRGKTMQRKLSENGRGISRLHSYRDRAKSSKHKLTRNFTKNTRNLSKNCKDHLLTPKRRNQPPNSKTTD